MPCHDTSVVELGLLLFKEIQKIYESVSSILTKYEHLKEGIEQFITDTKTWQKISPKWYPT